MISMSKPSPIISSFNGQASFNSWYRYAGRRFANRPNDFRIFKSPASGRLSGLNLYHGEVLASPPMEPIRTASHFFASSMVSSVSGTPCTSMEAPPSRRLVYSNLCPYFSQTASRTFFASSTISGPIPSPWINPIRYSISFSLFSSGWKTVLFSLCL